MYSDYYLYYFSYLRSLYSGYPPIVQFTVVIVMVLFSIVIFGILRILWTGYHIRRDEKRRQKVDEQFQEKIAFVLGNHSNYDIEEIEGLFKYEKKKSKKWKSEKLTDLILSIKDKLHGEGKLNLINYKNSLSYFGLVDYWEKQVRVSGLSKRKEAVQMIGVLDSGLNTGLLSKSVFHKNRYLRKTARNVHVEQDNYNPFRFMEENFDEAFTSLDKIRLHAALLKRGNTGRLPSLLRWVHNSKNSQYIAFIIQEIGYFKQYEAAPNLLELLDSQENRDVRAQIVRTLGELNYEDCVPDLIKRFPLETTPVRKAIVDAFGKIQTEDSLQLLLDVYQDTDDDNFKVSIVRAISFHGEKGKSSLSALKQSARDDEALIIDQIFAERAVVIG